MTTFCAGRNQADPLRRVGTGGPRPRLHQLRQPEGRRPRVHGHLQRRLQIHGRRGGEEVQLRGQLGLGAYKGEEMTCIHYIDVFIVIYQ